MARKRMRGMVWKILLALAMLIVIAMPVSAQTCCVTEIECLDNTDITQCSGDFFYDACMTITDCQLGCCCDQGQSAGLLVNRVFGYACLDQYSFVVGNVDDCVQICQGVQDYYYITGVVMDTNNNPLPDATVRSNDNRFANADDQGGYMILLPAGDWVLTASSPGCQDATSPVPALSTDIIGADFNLDCTPPVLPTCSDGIQNQGETGIDCGGPCGLCQGANQPMPCTGADIQTVDWIDLVQLPGEMNIRLDWAANASCDLNNVYFQIFRRAGASGPILVGDSTVFSFIDQGTNFPILENTLYEYKITMILANNEYINSDWKSIQTGSASCYGRSGGMEFCYQNQISQCDANNQLVSTPCAPQICVETATGAVCRAQGPCDECNWLYGMYGSLTGLRVGWVNAQGADEWRPCSDLLSLGVCFEDVSTTIVDPYKNCGNVISCEAYKSQQTCEGDPCQANLGCTWTAIYGNTVSANLGLGMCLGADSSCAMCDQLPGGCTANTCQQLPNQEGCYFSGDNCLSHSELTCNDYTTQQECENGQRVQVDATYDAQGRRTGGSHSFTPSADTYNLQKCYWSDASLKCWKDSDGYSAVGYPDDCDFTDIQCRRDFEPPTTTPRLNPQGSMGRNTPIGFTATDNSYMPDQIETYYCFSDSGACYPDTLATGDITIPSGSAGSMELYYYSVDPSKNLEPIRSQSLRVDTEAPRVQVDYTVQSQDTANGWRSTLDFTITASDNSNQVTCAWDLYKGALLMGSGTGDGQHSVTDLEDGIYGLVVTCSDISANTAERSISIPVEGDKRIFNLQPHDTFAQTTGLTLSAETSDDANCRYDVFNSFYNAMSASNDFQSTGGQMHTSPFAGSGGGGSGGSSQTITSSSSTLTITTPAYSAGTQVMLEILVAGVNDLAGAQLSVAFDSSSLSYLRWEEGNFMSEGGTVRTIPSDPTIAGGVVQNIAIGRATLPGPSGSGSLMRIFFQALTSGTSTFTIQNEMLGDSNLATINSGVLNLEATATQYTGGGPSTVQGEATLYEYNVACELDTPQGLVIVEDNPADVIIFAIDKRAPVTAVTDIVTDPAQPQGTIKSARISLECQEDELIDQNNVHWEFGCNRLFYCEGSGCTPQPLASDWADVTISGTSGTTTVRYYSVDNGENQEITQEMTFRIDGLPPTLNVQYTTSGRRTAAGVVSDIDVVVEAGEFITCDIVLAGTSQQFSESGDPVNVIFTEVPDGRYSLSVACSDITGNTANTQVEIVLDAANSMIKDPRPRGTFSNTGNYQLSINTTLPAVECRYDTTERAFDDMGNIFQSSGLFHSANAAITTPGLYIYNTACKLQNGSQVITVEDSDLFQIMFAIDVVPPITRATPQTMPQFTSVQATYSQVALILECRDESPPLGGQDFGCQDVNYCVVQSGQSCTPDKGSGPTVTVDIQMELGDVEGTFDINFRSTDKGGNTESVSTMTFNVDISGPSFIRLDIIADPGFLDSAQNLTVSSANSGQLNGQVTNDAVEICTLNDITGNEFCIQQCGGATSDCINNQGVFSMNFPIAQTQSETMNNIMVTATDGVGNQNSKNLRVLSDTVPPGAPIFTIED
ncbi:carboxypeptidase regulatory-like domain-containing protein [Nanoarchaeota archaeon]